MKTVIVLLAGLAITAVVRADIIAADVPYISTTHQAVSLLLGHDLTEQQYRRVTAEFAAAFPRDREQFPDVSEGEFTRRIIVEWMRQTYVKSRSQTLTLGEVKPETTLAEIQTKAATQIQRESDELFGDMPK